MRRTDRFLVVSALTVFAAIPVFSQGSRPGAGAPQRPIDQANSEARNDIWNTEVAGRDGMLPIALARRNSEAANLRLLAEQALKRLKVSKADREAYAEFLKQPRTGMIKLAPVVECSKMVDAGNPNNPCLFYYIDGRGAAFSFRTQKHALVELADFARTDGDFVTGGFQVLGMLTSLGDQPIEAIGASDPAVIEISQFAAATSVAQFEDQKKSLAGGIMIGNLSFSMRSPIRLNNTYLIRSVAYKPRFVNSDLADPLPRGFELDERRDVVFAFRLVSISEGGALNILWKELIRRESPTLETTRPKIRR